MRIIIWGLVTIFLLSSFLGSAQAQNSISPTPVDYKLPFPGLLPDHPLYPLKKLRDRILYLLTTDSVKKIELSLLFADKKIGMAENLVDKRKNDLASAAMLDSQMDLVKASSLLPELIENNSLPPGLRDKIELAAKKHQEIMEKQKNGFSIGKDNNNVNEALKLNNQAYLQIQSLKEKEKNLNN